MNVYLGVGRELLGSFLGASPLARLRFFCKDTVRGLGLSSVFTFVNISSEKSSANVNKKKKNVKVCIVCG